MASATRVLKSVAPGIGGGGQPLRQQQSAERLKMTFSEMTADEENGQGLHSGALGGSFRLLAILEEKVCIPLHSPRQSLIFFFFF